MLPLDSMIGPTEKKIYKCLQNLDYRVKKIKVVWDNTNAIIMYDDRSFIYLRFQCKDFRHWYIVFLVIVLQLLMKSLQSRLGQMAKEIPVET